MVTNQIRATTDTADAFLAQLCHASPSDARSLAVQMPAEPRARLALFCYARSHLREVGCAIAIECDEDSLAVVGGYAGRALFARSRGGDFREAGEPGRAPAKRITLARGRPVAVAFVDDTNDGNDAG